MPLSSTLLSGNKRLEACLVDHAAHVTPGSQGDFVHLIQIALIVIDDVFIASTEIDSKFYGESTAEAVLLYKKTRKIINHSYQTSEDNIVGKMTIKSLDDDMFNAQRDPAPPSQSVCQYCRPRLAPNREGSSTPGTKVRLEHRINPPVGAR